MAEKDDISIDFGKITKFFKKDKPKKTQAEQSSVHEPGKVHAEHSPAHKKEDELSFDISSVKDFIVRNQKIFLIIIPLLLVIIAGTFVRMQSMSLLKTDSWADSAVQQYYTAQIKEQVSKQYPNLPDANKNTLVEQQFQTFSAQNKDQIKQQKKGLSENYKQFFRDENGYNYMPDIDPYTYLRYARNYMDYGRIEDEIKNGTKWDNHILAPIGGAVSSTHHPYTLYYIYKIIHAFNSKITLMQAAGYFPIIFAVLSIIPAFFIGRRLGGTVGAFFSSAFVALSVAFVNRTLWDHADTDAYTIFFPLFIIWLFLEAFHQKEAKKQALCAAASAIFVSAFAFFWSGWWYVFDFVLGAAGLYLIYLLVLQSGEGFSLDKFKSNKKLVSLVLITVVFLLVSGIFVSAIKSFPTFYTSPLQPIMFSNLKVASHENLWPNVYTTVAELNEVSLSQIIDSIGGNIFFLISLLGIVSMFFIKNEEGKIDTKYFIYAFLLILWYVGIIYASTKGIRFTMMLVPPFALGLGTALAFVYTKSLFYFKKSLEVPKWVTGTLLIIFFLLFFVMPPAKASYNVAAEDVPMINDAWYNALNKIKIESAPNAIINSWWDFGHHFKYYADRAVTFDGATQNTPMAHWIGKTLLTDDEALAVGILRMLDCGSNKAFETLNAYVNDTSISVKMLYNVVVLDKANAKNYLIEQKLSESEAESVLKYTHCTPPEDYFITSGDMVGKGGVWAHFGSWNFDKADIWIYAKNLPKEKAVEFITKNTDVSKEEAEKLYYEVLALTSENDANSWIAPWPNYAGIANCVTSNNQTVKCANGIEIDLATMDVKVPTQQGVMQPYSLVYEKGSGIDEKTYNSSFPYSIAYFGNQIAVMDPALARSMFTRLFYFDGYGLDRFKKFTEEKDLGGDKIIVWKVVWP